MRYHAICPHTRYRFWAEPRAHLTAPMCSVPALLFFWPAPARSEFVTYPQLTFSLSLLDLNSLKGNKMLMCVSKELWDLGLYYQVLKKASGDPVLSRLTMLSCHPAWSARYHPLSSSSLCLGINQPSETSQAPRAADSEIIAGPNILKVQEEGHAHLLWTVVLFQGRHFERELIKMKGEGERQQLYSLTLR